MRRCLPLLFLILFTGCQKDTTTQTGGLPEVPNKLRILPFDDPTRGHGFLVDGVIPARFDTDEDKPIAALLQCGVQWNGVNKELYREYQNFRMWMDTSAAELDRTSFTAGDIRVSCEEDGSIRMKTGNILKTLALVRESGANETGVMREGSDIIFPGKEGALRLAMTETALAAGQGAAGKAVVSQGTDPKPLVGDGAAGPFTVDATKPVKVEIDRPGMTGQKDILQANYAEGWIGWHILRDSEKK